MFEIGKTYKIYEIDADGLSFHSATVIDWQPPLLKVSHPNGGHVIHNTASQYFHRAELLQSAHPKFDMEAFFSEAPKQIDT